MAGLSAAITRGFGFGDGLFDENEPGFKWRALRRRGSNSTAPIRASRAASVANQPTVSKLGNSGTTPVIGTRPCSGIA